MHVSNNIPIPTDEWNYRETTEENAQYKLTLSIDSGKVGGSRDFFLFRYYQPNDGSYMDIPFVSRIVLADGVDSSSISTIDIDDITQAGVIIDVYYRNSSSSNDSENIEVDHTITIPFRNKGTFEVGGITYRWEWLKLTPNQGMDLTR